MFLILTVYATRIWAGTAISVCSLEMAGAHIFYSVIYFLFGPYVTDCNAANRASAKQLGMLTVSCLFMNRQRAHNAGFGSPH